MIPLNKFKKALGKEADFMTNEEIFELRENQDKMAEILFNVWLTQNSKNEIQLRPQE